MNRPLSRKIHLCVITRLVRVIQESSLKHWIPAFAGMTGVINANIYDLISYAIKENFWECHLNPHGYFKHSFEICFKGLYPFLKFLIDFRGIAA